MRLEVCFICRKHASAEAAAGVVYEDESVIASLMAAGAGEHRAYMGYVMLESKRHVPGLGDLSEREAGAVGMAMNRISAALREGLQAEHVYSFVQGDGVPHFHMHLVPRYPGTPVKYWHPTHILQWTEAPRGGFGELEGIRGRIRDALGRRS
ncbi:HIT family protein [Paenibacillus rhizovicinus]|uniref:HIT family protein n=1 Tax=Paenibacillus rhizovicinus TaxID=2704463 RepID=A0A6C0P3E5_9BACL|nr:HIT family protein [Paenibacillus rhizovicinus]QHW33018.1 HIT family protein [Paenibacillus rhizovicinus]